MARKLSLLLGAVALLALAIPALANADSITSSKGVLATVNSAIVGTSTNTVTTNTPVGTLVCKHVQVGGTIKKNNGTEVEVTSTAAGTTKECTAEGLPLTIKEPKLTKLVAGNAANTTFVTLDFTAEVGKVICEYQNDSANSVPFTYVVGSDTIHIDGTLIDPKRANCATPTIEGDFTITIGGTPVILD